MDAETKTETEEPSEKTEEPPKKKKYGKDNLIPYTSETAVEAGRKGGRTMSLKKKLANGLRAVKHARYSKNETVLKMITPTPLEKVCGITLQNKLAIVKKIAPTLAADKVEDALLHYSMSLVDVKIEMLKIEKLFKKSAKTDKDKLVAANHMFNLKSKYSEKEWDFVKDVFGVGKSGFKLESTTETTETKLTLNKVMETVLGEIE